MSQKVFGHLILHLINEWMSLYYRNIKASVIHFKEKYSVQVKHFHKKNTRCCIHIPVFHIHISYTHFKLAFLYVCYYGLLSLRQRKRWKHWRKLYGVLTTIKTEFLGELFLYVSKHFWKRLKGRTTVCRSFLYYLMYFMILHLAKTLWMCVTWPFFIQIFLGHYM